MDPAHIDNHFPEADLPGEDSVLPENDAAREPGDDSVRSVDYSLDEWLEKAGALAAVASGEPLKEPITSRQAIKEALASQPCPFSPVLLELAAIPNEDMLRWTTLGSIIEQDQNITRSLLSVINKSSCILVPGQVKSVSHAASLLTTSRLLDLVLLVVIHQLWDRAPFNQNPLLNALDLVQHSALTSSVARLISNEMGAGRVHSFEAAVAGMLHDVGIFVLGRVIPQTYRAILQRRAEAKRSLVSTEREVLGCDHAVIGAHFASTLDLSPSIVEAIARHHSALGDSPRRTLAGVVTLADRLSNRRGVSVIPHEPEEPMDPSIKQFVWSVKPEWARTDILMVLQLRCGERISVRLTEIRDILSLLSDRSDFVSERPADFEIPQVEEVLEEVLDEVPPQPTEETTTLPQAAVVSSERRTQRPKNDIDFVCYLLPGLYSIQCGDRIEGILIMAIFVFSLLGLFLYGSEHWATTMLLVFGVMGAAVWNTVTMMRN